MTSLAVQEFNGQTIRIRKEDRYVCLTDMAKASGKQFKHWNELKSSNSYLEALSGVVGLTTTELVQINQGGIPSEQGTWGHPKVALRFAQWCSDEFAVQVDCWIDELVTTGKVELNKPASTADMLLMYAQAYKEHEQRLSAIELENIELKKQLAKQSHQVEAIAMESEANTAELERFRNGHGFYFSIAGFCSKLGIKRSLQWMNAQGRKASALCRQRGIVPQPVTNPRWGNVGTYPDSILEELTW